MGLFLSRDGRSRAMVSGTFQCKGVPLIWIEVGQRPTVLAVGAGGVCLDILSLIFQFSFLSPSLWETVDIFPQSATKPKQPTNQLIIFWPTHETILH